MSTTTGSYMECVGPRTGLRAEPDEKARSRHQRGALLVRSAERERESRYRSSGCNNPFMVGGLEGCGAVQAVYQL